jgi:hypothetical protein
MNLYQVIAHHSHEGTMYEWCGTQADAARAVKKFKNEFEVDPDSVRVVPVDFPTDKPGLLKWLNLNLIRDNG